MTSTPASRSAATRSMVPGVVPDAGADAQATVFVLARARKVGGLLEVLHRDHALELEVVTDDEHLLDAMLVQRLEHIVLGGVLGHGDEALLRRHDRRHGRIELGLEAQVAVRDDADHLAAADHGHAADAARAREIEHLANGHLGRDGDRVADHATLEFLDLGDFGSLRLGRHVPVNDTDAAFLRHGDGEARFGDRIHGSRQDRQAEADAACEAGGEVDFPEQNRRIGGHQQGRRRR